MATKNYDLHIIDKQTEIISPDKINENMVKIDGQMKTNALGISTLSQQVGSIDVTANVEEVVDRRLNSDRLKSLNIIIGEWKDAIVSAITTARDNIKNHVTSEHVNTKTKINTDVISARDSVNSNVDAEHITTRNAINNARDNINNQMKSISIVKSVQRGTTKVAGSGQSETMNVSISPVNINKSIVVLCSYKDGGTQASVYSATLINSSTLEIKTGTSYGSEISWQVIEFN